MDVDWIEDVDCGGDVIQSNFLTLDSAVQACYADSRCNCVQTDNSPEVSYWTRTGDSRNRRSGFISWVIFFKENSYIKDRKQKSFIT